MEEKMKFKTVVAMFYDAHVEDAEQVKLIERGDCIVMIIGGENSYFITVDLQTGEFEDDQISESLAFDLIKIFGTPDDMPAEKLLMSMKLFDLAEKFENESEV